MDDLSSIFGPPPYSINLEPGVPYVNIVNSEGLIVLIVWSGQPARSAVLELARRFQAILPAVLRGETLLTVRVADDALAVPRLPSGRLNFEISGDTKVIATGDVDARIAHLQRLRTPGPVDLGADDAERSQDDLLAELEELEALQEFGRQHVVGWGGADAVSRPAYLIREDHWNAWRHLEAADLSIPVDRINRADFMLLAYGGVNYLAPAGARQQNFPEHS